MVLAMLLTFCSRDEDTSVDLNQSGSLKKNVFHCPLRWNFVTSEMLSQLMARIRPCAYFAALPTVVFDLRQ